MRKTNAAEITDRDSALFEAGIKLGSLYHQFVGSPLSLSSIPSMENAIKESISAQPFVEDISVEIDRNQIKKELNDVFGYTELSGKMLSVRGTIRFNSARVYVSMTFNETLNYPLMQIDKIEENIE